MDGTLIGVMYGPLVYLHPKAADAVAVAFLAQVHTMWQASFSQTRG